MALLLSLVITVLYKLIHPQNQFSRSSLAGPSQVGPRFRWETVHILQRFGPRLGKKGASLWLTALLNPQGIKIHKRIVPPSKPTFESGSPVCLDQSVQQSLSFRLFSCVYFFLYSLSFVFFLFETFHFACAFFSFFLFFLHFFLFWVSFFFSFCFFFFSFFLFAVFHFFLFSIFSFSFFFFFSLLGCPRSFFFWSRLPHDFI